MLVCRWILRTGKVGLTKKSSPPHGSAQKNKSGLRFGENAEFVMLQVLHGSDVELTIRATGQTQDVVIDRQRFEPFDRRYFLSTPAAVMIGPIGIRCRIFSTDFRTVRVVKVH
jgi:hypothetical protein